MSEVRTVSSLALLYAFRMLGLFMVLPVLMLYGDQYQGATPLLLGLALGVYGLTQACFQIPLGMLSDIVGRKPVIAGGLVVFAIGSVVAAVATTVEGLIIGRALQGSGAIASAIMAMVADLTSEENRTKAMAAIGASIGLSFSLAMILGPALAAIKGLSGVFALSAILSCIGIAIVFFLVPTPTSKGAHRDVAATPELFKQSVQNGQLLRLNLGIFSLHCILMVSFVCIPGVLESTLSLPKESHWQFYLPILLLAFIAMLPLMIVAEKKRKIKPVFLAAVLTLSVSCLLLMLQHQSFVGVVFIVFVFFVAFNLLESILPSLVSKIAPAGTKGTAMGIYSTSQFLGAFSGGLVGGWILQHYSVAMVFAFCAVLALLWFIVAISMLPPKHLTSLCVSIADDERVKKISQISGVEEAFHVIEESLLYLKVDKAKLDEQALNELAGLDAK
ncbi:MFS transporter [Agarilytica rhodophyticola]|uniref:MFS transporter n=1 Tax=Agarilytica rhodophyticola TaxID=1737490 RepID=UPI001FEB4613|nr:MFS transporter [Agarilytica rhodophyticola]